MLDDTNMPLFALMDKDVAIPIVRIVTDKATDKKLLKYFNNNLNISKAITTKKSSFMLGIP